MANEHIIKSFDVELEKLAGSIAEMGRRSQAQLEAAIAALLSRDRAAAARVVKADLAIDALEREIDVHAIKVLALRHPIARDLREVISVLRIALDFERICDYAKNVAKRVIALEETAPVSLLESIAKLSTLAQQLLGNVLSAFVDRDAPRALEVWASDEKLDEAFSAVHQRILGFMRESPANVSDGAHLLFVAKNIERIGDHATNVAEAVHFMVTGEALVAERPKGDRSSEAAPAP
jgi:phosphate transport system protein